MSQEPFAFNFFKKLSGELKALENLILTHPGMAVCHPEPGRFMETPNPTERPGGEEDAYMIHPQGWRKLYIYIDEYITLSNEHEKRGLKPVPQIR